MVKEDDDDGFTWVIQPEEKKENQREREREIFQMVLFFVSSFHPPLNEEDEGNGLESYTKKRREGNQLILGIISFFSMALREPSRDKKGT